MKKHTHWAKATRDLMKKYLGKGYNSELTFMDKRKYGYRLRFCCLNYKQGTHILQEQLCKDLGMDYVQVAIQEVKPEEDSRYSDVLVISVPFWSEDGSAEHDWAAHYWKGEE